MAYVGPGELMRRAEKEKRGLAAFNVMNYESIAWAIEAAELEHTPILIQMYPAFASHIPMEVVVEMTKMLAGRVSVPVGLHLDHSFDIETIKAGIDAGFPSVMIDASRLPFYENVKLTRQVVNLARPAGVLVEAELGHVGSGASAGDFQDPANFTDPAAARAFIEATGADSLAVSIGNAHGAYAAAPELQFDLLEKIRAQVPVPLVLHGGSDIPPEQLQRAVALGISKVNIATEYERAMLDGYAKALENPPWKGFFAVVTSEKPYVMDFLRGKIRLLRGAPGLP